MLAVRWRGEVVGEVLPPIAACRLDTVVISGLRGALFLLDAGPDPFDRMVPLSDETRRCWLWAAGSPELESIGWPVDDTTLPAWRLTVGAGAETTAFSRSDRVPRTRPPVRSYVGMPNGDDLAFVVTGKSSAPALGCWSPMPSDVL